MTWDDGPKLLTGRTPGARREPSPRRRAERPHGGRARPCQPPRGPDPSGPGAKSEGTPEDMCGVVGLRLKDPALHPMLGELVVPMLDVLASRGPDSTGVAIYRHDAGPGALKYSLSAQAADYDWGGYLTALEARVGGVPVELRRRSRDAVVVTSLGAE